MNNQGKVDECPKCGSRELGQGRHSGYSAMTPVGGILGSNIMYTICSKCGYIIEGYVTNPKRFKKR
ncbi:transcription initiation factor TFIIIB [Pueribacillus theae]|uniref:Transcription initiation factor TFIIIB n=2 Tax=Pueribacillus theae TaxID=2171751 RepID=A0A2U1JJJ3_9BACI|nr:transcription initiation factor TFIIIB [Pueribacillus theae]PWA05311.1 transcription initiation factor TFIIIB [Pueribacillus theae]